MKWFRFYDDVMDDPKLMTLPGETFKFWTALLCLANRSKIRGTLPPLEEIVYRTRFDAKNVENHLECLILKNLVTKTPGGKLAIYKWDVYQCPSDDAATRQRNYRKGKKKEPKNEPEDPPKNGTSDNGVARHVATQSRDSHALEERRGEEKRREEKTPPSPPRGESVCVSTPEPQTRKPDPPPKPSPKIFAPDEAAASEITGPGKDSPEAIALGEWAKTLGSGPDNEPYHVWAKAVCDYTPAEWVRAALEAHVVGRSGANLKSLPYLQGVLRKWFAVGACPTVRMIGKPSPMSGTSDSDYHVAQYPPRTRRTTGTDGVAR